MAVRGGAANSLPSSMTGRAEWASTTKGSIGAGSLTTLMTMLSRVTTRFATTRAPSTCSVWNPRPDAKIW